MAGLKIGKMVLGSLFKKPATKMYPVRPAVWMERTRGHIEIVIEDCIFCGICQKKCPTDAITVDRAAKSWAIQRMGCIQCSCCVEVCPKKCLTNEAGYTAPETEKITDTFIQPEKEPEVKKEAKPKKETSEAEDEAKSEEESEAKPEEETAEKGAEPEDKTELDEAADGN